MWLSKTSIVANLKENVSLFVANTFQGQQEWKPSSPAELSAVETLFGMAAMPFPLQRGMVFTK